MAEVTLRIVESEAGVATLRTEDMRAALAAKPDLVLVGNTGHTPVAMYAAWGAAGLDLSRVHLRMLDAYVMSPSRGFDETDHAGCFSRFVVESILEPLDPECRPRDWTMPPENLTTCEELSQDLEENPDVWDRLVHPVTGEAGSEFVIREEASGSLALVRRTCAAYEALLRREALDVVSLGIGPMPYPHMAFNCGPYTRPDATTHLALIDTETREANGPDFGGADRVPPFAITTGPASLVRSARLWITAIGAGKSEPLAWALGDPRASDFEFRSSIGYALRAPSVDIVLDEAAATGLCDDGGLKGLEARYAEAGHRVTARRS